MSVHSKFGKRFGFERLEPRTVLNGTVVATLEGNGQLILDGDVQNNVISIHQVGSNTDGGAILQIVGSGTKILNAATGKSAATLTLGSSTGVKSLEADMEGGSDTLNLFNTTLPQTMSIRMDEGTAGGNDVLIMTNVHTLALDTSLGNGNNVATITNVNAGDGFTLAAGNGKNVVALNKLVTDSKITASIIVSLGNGKGNTLTAINCVSPEADLAESGTGGVLSGVGNLFGTQFVDTFQFRFGDLKNNTV